MTKIEDSDLRRRVIAELDREPSIDASQIGVAVKDGIVTLTGTVLTYPERKNAEKVASRVAGVRAVVGDLESSYSAAPHGAISTSRSQQFATLSGLRSRIQDS